MSAFIQRKVTAESLEWPNKRILRSESLGGNRDYYPIGRMGWKEVQETINDEVAILQLILGSEDPEAEHENWEESTYEEPDGGLLGLDLGTNSLSAALSASGCVTFYSCNGGIFGGHHNDSHPVIAFYCPRDIFPVILESSVFANTGLYHGHSGGIAVYSRRVTSFVKMAKSLYRARRLIRKIRRQGRGVLETPGAKL